ncbi:MAG: LysM peptidoglycan-binding domain-containing protein [bacterium]|nr:LysM peptidoglycan-binding domain-containing protein [bacterium]
MKNTIKFLLMLFFISFILTGCDEDKLKNEVLTELIKAEKALLENKSVNVHKLAPYEFSRAVNKYNESEKLIDESSYVQAKLSIEGFYGLLEVAKNKAMLMRTSQSKKPALKTKEVKSEKKEKAVNQEKAVKQKKAVNQKKVVNQKVEKTVPANKVEQIKYDGYQIVKGDTLWELAKRNYNDGFKWELIYQANKAQIENPDLIFTDQSIRIPVIK